MSGLAEVFRAHHADVGPISGRWLCACGLESTDGSILTGDLTSRDQRRDERAAHLAAVVAAWLLEDAQVERAAKAIGPASTWRATARAALTAVTKETTHVRTN